LEAELIWFYQLPVPHLCLLVIFHVITDWLACPRSSTICSVPMNSVYAIISQLASWSSVGVCYIWRFVGVLNTPESCL